eukprot:TRINITY_DN12593_c0_g1_i2.p5 TRINITY_DN12593_c0_g1~~TRINITY_DN12593_c0_g1_i2.p5  ORF type:complete len:118 (-),score=4.96 TRINITY_DN12593_c0_g1_i2:90-443(-)
MLVTFVVKIIPQVVIHFELTGPCLISCCRRYYYVIQKGQGEQIFRKLYISFTTLNCCDNCCQFGNFMRIKFGCIIQQFIFNYHPDFRFEKKKKKKKDWKSTRLNSSHEIPSRMPSSA